MKREPQNVEIVLSHAIKLETYEQSLSTQGSLVDGCAKCRPHAVCAVGDPLDVGKAAMLRRQVSELRGALTQLTRRMASFTARPWSGLATPHNAASSVGSILDAVLTQPAPAPGQMASGQPGHGGGCRCGDRQCSRKTDVCWTCKQLGHWANECDQWRTESAIRGVMCRRFLWSIQACQEDCRQCRRLR